ncbi:MAG: hypothetical protein VCE91_13010 [Nitrospinota bacterium]
MGCASHKAGAQKNRGGPEKIYVTGHSLGGATATVVAFALKLLRYNVDAAYVYAPPKVGDSALARSIKSTLSVYAVVNYRDPVPTIPHYVNLQRYTPLLKGYVSVMDASRESIYFNRKHRAIEFGSRTNPATRERKIRRDQGNPRPILLFRGGAMSNEWKFHHGKFDTAYAYFKIEKIPVLSGTRHRHRAGTESGDDVH